MNLPTLLRYFAGYIFSFFIFVLLIPFYLYKLDTSPIPAHGRPRNIPLRYSGIPLCDRPCMCALVQYWLVSYGAEADQRISLM